VISTFHVECDICCHAILEERHCHLRHLCLERQLLRIRRGEHIERLTIRKFCGRKFCGQTGVGTFTKAKPAQKINAVLFSQSATPSTKRQRLDLRMADCLLFPIYEAVVAKEEESLHTHSRIVIMDGCKLSSRRRVASPGDGRRRDCPCVQPRLPSPRC
jgi:hypothetical protein